MSALTNREQARARLHKVFEGLLDRYVPADESVPMRGCTFREWEDQADEFDQQMTGALLEALAGLDDAAEVEEAGRCPHCSSDRVYLAKDSRQVEVQTKHGLVVLQRQTCRCRACNRSFSPSGAIMGIANGSGPVPESR